MLLNFMTQSTALDMYMKNLVTYKYTMLQNKYVRYTKLIDMLLYFMTQSTALNM